ncbi:hypothetical protein [Microbulbifer marinus]|uniref:MotA/TolQ/ExbB proton channel family protein n=1 Tax=Microbulbifer marinus TaxID=658218 RepID=A0A1H3ZA33_9GAMM|nr:hypothetical protein [Microbulbifer marinus]SEA20540.1 hypothetical protein SAMN05216562_2278 [Microbulbifer marinus]
MESISQFLSELKPEWVFWLINGLLVWQFIRYWQANDEQALEHGPTTLTTIGVVGTFIGISLGLANFDVKDIQGSIPPLLEGLKTAFLTSIFGILLGLGIKHKKLKLLASSPVEEFTPERFQQMFQGHLDSQAELTQTMKVVAENLNSNKEDSISSILAKVRNDLADQSQKLLAQRQLHHNESREDMANFIKELAEQSTKAIIEQLEQVIRDFNENLAEQFGENFKRLDESVKALLEWQQQYKQQIEKQTEAFESAAEQQGRTAQALTEVEQSTRAIPDHMSQMDAILKANADQLEALTANLGSFAKLREKAEEALPVIDEHIASAIKTVEQAVERASGHYQNLLTDSRTMLDDFSSTSKKFAGEFKEATREGSQAISKSLGDVADDVRSSSDSLVKGVREVTNDMKLDMQSTGENLKRSVNEQVQQIFTQFERTEFKLKDLLQGQWDSWDTAMQQEVSRVIQALANELGAVSGAFVHDYKSMLSQINGTMSQVQQTLQPDT